MTGPGSKIQSTIAANTTSDEPHQLPFSWLIKIQIFWRL
jgi:hypothetical protein